MNIRCAEPKYHAGLSRFDLENPSEQARLRDAQLALEP
jgi:hypothetical protein